MEFDFNTEIEQIMQGERALSYSALRAFLKSPKHFKEYKTDKEVTKAMKEGKQFHMACLEPEKFKNTYWVLDDSEKCQELINGGAKSPRATKEYKAWLVEQDSKNEGKERLSKEDYDTFMNMSEALRNNSSSGKFMNNLTSTEEYFEFETDGFHICGVIDGRGVNEDVNFKIDLKKVADASYEKVKWEIERSGYHMQGGLYTRAEPHEEYYLIYIDKGCNITVVQLSSECLDRGYSRFEFALAKFQECAESDLWDSSYEFYNGGHILYT